MENKRKKTYKSYINFAYVQLNPEETTFCDVAYYTMLYMRDKDSHLKNYAIQLNNFEDDYFEVEFIFVNNLTGIKLYQINVYTYINITD